MLLRFLFQCLLVLLTFQVSSQEIGHPHSMLHSFVENKGQWDENVLFQSKLDGGNLWIQQHKFVFHLQDFTAIHAAHGNTKQKKQNTQIKQDVIHLNFVGSNKVNKIEKSIPTKVYYNYFLGDKKEKWASEVHGYSEAILRNLYSEIDLRLIENELNLKYEFIVHPNSDPNQILLNYAGQKNVEIDKNGNLILTSELGQIIEKKPYAYQIINGRIKDVKCQFNLDGNNLTFELGSYNSDVELVIDPILVFATYCGSITDNFGMTATYGYDGSAFSGGTIYGNAYPTPDNSAYDVTSNFTVADNPTYGITDAFLTKYSPDGTTMIWTTFIGGGDGTQGTETVHSLIADKQNNIYLYGATSSTDFPIVNGYQSTHGGGVPNSNFYFNGVYFTNQGTDIYVAKVSANGQNLLGSTYMGGSSNDGVNYKLSSGTYNSVAAYDSLTKNYGDQFRGEVMIDSVGNCIVASCSRSQDFPVLNAFQSSNAGNQDGVIFKLNSDLSSLIWSSYYGGSNNDACYSVKIDSSYNVVFAGGTSSSNLPSTSAGWQSTYNGGKTDGFVAKINGSTNALMGASYIGTPNYDQTFFVEIDRTDNVFVLGQSEGSSFPVFNATYVNPGSSQYIAKLTPDLTTLQNSTVFGNGDATINISPSAFLVDICGNIYVSGWGANILQNTGLTGMPVTPDAFQLTPPNGYDFYLFVLQREFQDILYATYLGGAGAEEHVDGGTSRFDKNGVVYQSVCGGCFNNGQNWSDFPTTPNAWSNLNLSNNCNNLLFKFDFELIPNAEFTVDNTLGCAPMQVTFDNFSTDSDSYLWDFGNNDTSSVIFNPTITYDTAGVYQVFLYVTDSICLLTDTAEITIVVTDSLEVSTSIDLELCSPIPVDLTAFTNGSATNFIWSSNQFFSDTLNTDLSDSVLSILPSGTTTYYVQVSNDGCSLTDSVVVSFISSDITLSANDSICVGQTTTILATNSNPSISFTYVWSPDTVIVNPSVTNSVTVAPTISQYIYLTASSNTGCIIEDSILISVGNIPDGLINASASDYLVPVGAVVDLMVEPSGYQYSWFDPLLVDNPNAQMTSTTVYQSTLYQVTATDGICTKSDTVFISVYDYVCDDPYVFIPNAFSPNGDGENDVLYVRGDVIESILFRVFDRWGEMVFESTDLHNGWDGTFRDKKMDPDVYDYYLEVYCINGDRTFKKGNVTLMK